MSEPQYSNREAIRRGMPIFIAAISMRAGLTVINPLIPIFKEQYHISSFALSFLTSLSLLCFAGTAFLMPIVAKLGGTDRIIALALTTLTVALVVRAIGNLFLLFASALILGIAIAVLNFSLPVWVKENDAEHSGLLTGIYITIMGIFAAGAVAIAVPLANLTRWGWRFSMLPLILLGAIPSLWWLKRTRLSNKFGKNLEIPKFHSNTFRSWPAWSIAIYFGLQSMIFYGTATWMPTILTSKGYALSDAGFAVAATGVLSSVIGIMAPHFASKLSHLELLLVVLSCVLAVTFFGLMFDHGWHLILWLLVMSTSVAISFPLALLLTVIRSSNSHETRSLSIMTQSIGYAMAFFGPGMIGATFDISQNWNVALIVPVFLTVLLGVFGYFAGKPEKIVLTRS